MSDGAYELGLERGRGEGGGVSYLNNVSYVSRNRKCDGSRHAVVLYPPGGRDVTWPQSHPSARGRSCQQPEALTAGSLFANLTFDLNRDRRERARAEKRDCRSETGEENFSAIKVPYVIPIFFFCF